MSVTEQIIEQILSNLKSKLERKIGVEYETIVYDKNLKRLPPNSDTSISSEKLVEELKKMQAHDTIKAGYTIEPGGQIEWASPPFSSLHEIDQHLKRHNQRFNNIVDRHNLTINEYSVEPKYLPEEIPLIDNDKYQLMDKMFTKSGKLGKWMMRNTSSVQINIDFSSIEDAQKMAFVADCIAPLASILFANSPHWKGEPIGTTNLRYKIWQDTDSTRCGDLFDHNIKSETDLIQKYAEYVQSVPAIFVEDDKHNIKEFSSTLGLWMENLNKKGKLTAREIQIALHQIFTNIRFKNVIEIRCCDKPPTGYELAPVAFWTGLLLSESTLDKVFEMVKCWTCEEREALKRNAFSINLQQSAPHGKRMGDWIFEFVAISENGLEERSKNNDINGEMRFLSSYIEHIKEHGIPSLAKQNSSINRENPAQELRIK